MFTSLSLQSAPDNLLLVYGKIRFMSFCNRNTINVYTIIMHRLSFLGKNIMSLLADKCKSLACVCLVQSEMKIFGENDKVLELKIFAKCDIKAGKISEYDMLVMLK